MSQRRSEILIAASLMLAGCANNNPDVRIAVAKSPTPPSSLTTPSLYPQHPTEIDPLILDRSLQQPTATDIFQYSAEPIPTTDLSTVCETQDRSGAVITSFKNEPDNRVVFSNTPVEESVMRQAKDAVAIADIGCTAVFMLNLQGQVVIPFANHCIEYFAEGVPNAGFVGHPDFRWYNTEVIHQAPDTDFALLNPVAFDGGYATAPQATTQEVERVKANQPLVVINYQAGRDEVATIFSAQLPVLGITDKRIVVAYNSVISLHGGGSSGPIFVPTDTGLKVGGVLSCIHTQASPYFAQYQKQFGFASDGSFQLAEFIRVR